MVITRQDCGTTQGITKGVIYRGEKVEVKLSEAVKGRVSRQNIVNPVTDDVVVREDELITTEIAKDYRRDGAGTDSGTQRYDLRSTVGDLPIVLRNGSGHRKFGRGRNGGRYHRGPEYRGAWYPADHAYISTSAEWPVRTSKKVKTKCKKGGIVKLTRMRVSDR